MGFYSTSESRIRSIITDIPRICDLSKLPSVWEFPKYLTVSTNLSICQLFLRLLATIPVFAPVMLFVASRHFGLLRGGLQESSPNGKHSKVGNY